MDVRSDRPPCPFYNFMAFPFRPRETSAAATRCREKKKQWLQQLQQRANTLNTSNKQMYTDMNRLREEVSALKNLITQQQARLHIALGQNRFRQLM